MRHWEAPPFMPRPKAVRSELRATTGSPLRPQQKNSWAPLSWRKRIVAPYDAESVCDARGWPIAPRVTAASSSSSFSSSVAAREIVDRDDTVNHGIRQISIADGHVLVAARVPSSNCRSPRVGGLEVDLSLVITCLGPRSYGGRWDGVESYHAIRTLLRIWRTVQRDGRVIPPRQIRRTGSEARCRSRRVAGARTTRRRSHPVRRSRGPRIRVELQAPSEGGPSP
jgi:hypothetical protein